MEKNTIKVEREAFELNGKTYFGYFVSGNIRGRHVKAGIKPPDNGGYTVLDIVFDGAMEAELSVTPFEMKAEDGRNITGNIRFSTRSYIKGHRRKRASIQNQRHRDLCQGNGHRICVRTDLYIFGLCGRIRLFVVVLGVGYLFYTGSRLSAIQEEMQNEQTI